MIKVLYILVRGNSIFSFPFLKKLRNLIYQKKFNASGLVVSENVMIKPAHYSIHSKIEFGKENQIDRDVLIDYTAPITIGEYVTFSSGVKVFTHNHSVDDKVNIHESEIIMEELIIEDFVWFGTNAMILPSVKKIGYGAIIAAGAIVTKNINKFEVVGGNPAKVIKIRELKE